MTSLEALERIRNRNLNQKDYEIIERDLKLLAELKKFLLPFYEKRFHEFVSCVEINNKYISKKVDTDSIKEWLEK